MPPPPTLSGTTLGRYRLEALIGRGGMAEVYRAADTKLDRTVAVKVILPAHAANPKATQRFLHEARLVASLEHPNILPIYDFGDDDGQTYLVMPLLPGGSLAERMRGRRVPHTQALVWLRQLGDALDAAHAAGVVHRDVKPANALLGGGDRLFLADFGIGRMLEAGSGLTATGAVLGTPAYMAPEQAQGRPATPAADRYALGAMAFEMLAGRPPFLGESVLSVLHLHVSAPVPVASTVAPGLPAGVDITLTAALAKDPTARPPSCRALVDSLEAGLLGPAAAVTVPLMDAPTVALQTAATALSAAPGPRETSTTPAGPRPPHRRMAVVAAVAVGALVAAFGFAVLRPRPAQPLPTPAPAPVTSPASVPPPTIPPAMPLPVTVVEVHPDPKSAPPPAPLAEMHRAFAVALARGRLTPPAQGNALELHARMREAYPAEHLVADSRDRLVGALKRHAAAGLESGAVAEARDDLARAQGLSPDDPEIAALMKRAVVALAPPRSPPSAVPALPGAPAPPVEVEPLATGTSVTGEEPESRRHRLEQSVAPGHQPARADFEAARDAALAVGIGRKGASTLLAYAQGGLDYLDHKDAAAGQALVEASREQSRPGLWEMRPYHTNVQEPDGAYVAPSGWKLALAYADVRGEAEGLIAADLARRPGEPLVLFARATLRRQQGRDAESIADGIAAFATRPAPAAAASIAELLGDTYNRLKQWEEAVRWYRAGVEPRNPLTGQCAYSAARLLTTKLERPDEALPLLQVACRSDVKKACADLGERRGNHPGGKRRR